MHAHRTDSHHASLGSAVLQPVPDVARTAASREEEAAPGKQPLSELALEVVKSLVTSEDFETAVRDGLSRIGRTLGCRRIRMLLASDPSTPSQCHTLAYDWQSSSLPTVSDECSPHYGEAALSEDLAQLKRGDGIWGSFESDTTLCLGAATTLQLEGVGLVPIFRGQRYIGCMVFDGLNRRQATPPSELDALELCAQTIGALIHQRAADKEELAALATSNKRERARADQSERVSSFLNRTLGSLSAGADLQHSVESIVAGLALEIGAFHVFLLRHDAVNRTLRLDLSVIDGTIRRGLSGEEFPLFSAPFPDDITPGWRIMIQTRGLFTPESSPISPQQFGWPGVFEYAERYSLSDMGHIVLFAGDNPVGSMGFSLVDGRKIRPEDHAFIEEVAKQAALAIQIADLAASSQRDAVAAAVAVEKQQAAEFRATELAKANASIRRSLDQLAGRTSLEGFIPQILKEAMTAAGASNAALFRIRDSQMLMELFLQADTIIDISNDPRFAMWTHPIHYDQAPNTVKKLVESDLIVRIIPDQAEDLWPPSIEWHRQMGHEQVVICPLSVGAELLGFIDLAFNRGTSWSSQREEIIHVLGQQMSLAIHLMSLAEISKEAAVALERRNAAEDRASVLANANRSLRNVGDRLASVPERTSFVCHVIEELCRQVHSPMGTIFEFDTSGKTLRLSAYCKDGVASLGVPPVPWLPKSGVVPTDSAFWRELESTRAPVEFEPCGRGPQPPSSVAKGMHERGFRRSLNFPLVLGDELLGFVGLLLRYEAPLDAVQMELVRSLTQQVAVGLRLSRLAEEAQQSEILAERNRIARDLHDTLAQSFTAILMQLQAASSYWRKDPPLAQACAERAEKIARQGLREARHSVAQLAQSETELQDVTQAICQLAEECTTGTDSPCAVSIEGQPALLPAFVKANIVRICREALANAQRYAAAERIQITLAFREDGLELRISDNGRGFRLADAGELGFGLAGMRARAERLGGSFVLTSEPNRGTTIDISIPLQR